MVYTFFFLGLMTFPFSAIPGISLLGELQHELSAYFFLTSLTLATFPLLKTFLHHQKVPLPYALPQITLFTGVIIALSFLINFPDIMNNSFRGRTGINKFITSSLVLFYGLSLSCLAYALVNGRWKTLILRPIAISAGLCAAFSLFEVASWHINGLKSAYAFLSSLVHAGYGWDVIGNRLRSVSFEPPSFANYAGFAWPWIYAGVATEVRGKKILYLALLAALTGMIFLSASRTGFILLAGNVLTIFFLRTVYLPYGKTDERLVRLATFALACATAVALALFYLNIEHVVHKAVMDDNVSNISRAASNAAALSMFKDNPFFGLGFGQYAFYLNRYMPFWGYYSWEILAWTTNPESAWPPVFSAYARFGAELGSLGLAMWLALWLWLTRKIWQTACLSKKATGILAFEAYPLISSCIGTLLSGIPTESLRTPLIWITLGTGCWFIKTYRMPGQAG